MRMARRVPLPSDVSEHTYLAHVGDGRENPTGNPIKAIAEATLLTTKLLDVAHAKTTSALRDVVLRTHCRSEVVMCGVDT